MENKVTRKKFRAGKGKVIAFIVVLVLFIIAIVALLTSKSNPLVGKWKNDSGDTIYQFYKDNTGKLILRDGEYEYKYEIKDDKVSVNFENKASQDTEFTFKIEDKKLTLKSSYATVTFEKMD